MRFIAHILVVVALLDLRQTKWFAIPLATTAVAYAVHVTDSCTAPVVGARAR